MEYSDDDVLLDAKQYTGDLRQHSAYALAFSFGTTLTRSTVVRFTCFCCRDEMSALLWRGVPLGAVVDALCASGARLAVLVSACCLLHVCCFIVWGVPMLAALF